DALDAVHRALHVRVEVLHAEAGAVEADLDQSGDLLRADRPRVDLDGEIAIGCAAQLEVAGQLVDHAGQLGRAEEVRCAAAEVHLHHRAVAVDEGAGAGDLFVEQGDVLFAARPVTGDDLVAAA